MVSKTVMLVMKKNWYDGGYQKKKHHTSTVCRCNQKVMWNTDNNLGKIQIP